MFRPKAGNARDPIWYTRDLGSEALVLVSPLNARILESETAKGVTTISGSEAVVLVSPLNRNFQIRNAIFTTQRYWDPKRDDTSQLTFYEHVENDAPSLQDAETSENIR